MDTATNDDAVMGLDEDTGPSMLLLRTCTNDKLQVHKDAAIALCSKIKAALEMDPTADEVDVGEDYKLEQAQILVDFINDLSAMNYNELKVPDKPLTSDKIANIMGETEQKFVHRCAASGPLFFSMVDMANNFGFVHAHHILCATIALLCKGHMNPPEQVQVRLQSMRDSMNPITIP